MPSIDVPTTNTEAVILHAAVHQRPAAPSVGHIIPIHFELTFNATQSDFSEEAPRESTER